jgi:hypothetical protein
MRRKETAHHRRIRSVSALGRRPIAKRLQPCLTSRLSALRETHDAAPVSSAGSRPSWRPRKPFRSNRCTHLMATSSATSDFVGGDIFHERLNLDQLHSARPELGHADYRMPIPGLMCSASTHPGGGVTGAPGHNAAREMIRDFRARRWIKGIFRIELRSSSQEGQRPSRAASRS